MNKPATVLYVQAPGVQLRAVDDDSFLIDPENGTIHHLNMLGAAIWRQLDEPVAVDDLLDLLCAAFPDVPKTRIKLDLNSLLITLEAQKLVILSNGRLRR